MATFKTSLDFMNLGRIYVTILSPAQVWQLRKKIFYKFICEHLESGNWRFSLPGEGLKEGVEGTLPFVILVPLELCRGHCWGFTLQRPLLSHRDACALSFWNVGRICRKMFHSTWKWILTWKGLPHSWILSLCSLPYFCWLALRNYYRNDAGMKTLWMLF